MKFIGFIKQQDNDFFAKDLQKYYLANDKENKHRDVVLEYLKKGILCVAFMGIAEDEEENRMGTISVFTDGEWFWPDYLNGYLNKFRNFKIDEDFIKHVLKNKDKKVEISEEENLRLEKEFIKIAWDK